MRPKFRLLSPLLTHSLSREAPKRALISALLMCTAAGFAFPVSAAQDAIYDVEVLMFIRLDANGEQMFSEDYQRYPSRNRLPLSQISAGTPEAQPLAREQLSLGGAFGALRRSRNLRPLLHTGWRQSLRGRDNVPWLHLDTGSPIPGNDSPLSHEFEADIRFFSGIGTSVEVDAFFEEPNEQQSPQSDQGFDWQLQSEAEPAIAAQQRPGFYRVRETRRIKSGELHYFDHPKFGLIIKVTPYVASLEQELENQLLEEFNSESEQPSSETSQTGEGNSL